MPDKKSQDNVNQSAFTKKHFEDLINLKTERLLLHSKWWERLFLTNYNWVYRAMRREAINDIRFPLGSKSEFGDIPKELRNQTLHHLGEKEDAL